MRIAAVVAVLIAVLAFGGLELMWRLEHPVIQQASSSPSGTQVAEARSMPEGSVVPYGSGVFLRSKWAVLLSVQSELAFAAYCADITAHWPREQQLSIHCELLEGKPFVAGPVVSGTSVQVSVQRKQAANEPLHPILGSAAPRRPSAG